ncbi:DNA-processing protein DprA [Nostocoides jenkinsii]|jgi:DNA processing protein|uniref:Smf/DprA SLOG domain-containing protein n=1 Tax=Nostocoides jenkinsii Ben 74 TaxID=1193518 RepID=A0A077MFC0_9MICO|nr:DNA-processing protein DprA [Tetrasphaera jenkinsii]CCI53798.1 conserved hypothetical protein [Tetrasphaera jenkinsii Ben 74]
MTPAHVGPNVEVEREVITQQEVAAEGVVAERGVAAERGVVAERDARILLARLAEPGDEIVQRELSVVGYEGLAQDVLGPQRSAAAKRLGPRLERLRGDGGLPNDDAIAARLDARIITPADSEWPAGLADLEHPPHCLWVRGPVRLDVVCRRSVAIVGARAATAYGVDRASEIASGLASRGFAVISGAAFGIDGAAHRGALAVQGITVAVLACGIDRPYPQAHSALIQEIGRAGAVVTELPPGAAPYRGRFLLRNRLLAAMSGGVVVIEAAMRSGSLQTAGRAAAIGRPVGALPGPVTSMASGGCHQAIRDQLAVLVTDAAEVADLVGDYGRDVAEPARGPEVVGDRLPPEQRALWEVLPVRHPATAAELAERAVLAHTTALAALASLELLGLAERTGDLWHRPRAS